ncbi:MAG: MBL fold metallo-hydrolase, partial [Synechococcaceae cyanobacterium SM2_3_60]|nr:MBL fold metallo-hydrolase [Synechococcaceae cyanobacterium SM2_3_60]
MAARRGRARINEQENSRVLRRGRDGHGIEVSADLPRSAAIDRLRLFQGYKQWRERNWQGLPFSPRSVDAIALTHAHIDHSGYLPLLIKQGFLKGEVHATAGTVALCGILLPDSGHLQEADAEFANRKGFSRHRPALPLYTRADAERSLSRFRAHEFGQPFSPVEPFTLSFHQAGHILGAASVHVNADDTTILFSGDLGRSNDPLMRPPAPRQPSDYLVLESTYGDRKHGSEDAGDALVEVMTDKATIEVPTPFAGTMVEHRANEGDVCAVGSVIAILREGAAVISQSASPEPRGP